MESIVGELLCPVCLEFYNYPVILPCAHILCRSPCAERLFDHGLVRCPVCRDSSFVSGGVPHLPRVISLENIIEKYKSPPIENQAVVVVEKEVCGSDDIPCQLCEGSPNKAKKSCLDCNASYCTECLNVSHPQREPFIHHKLVFPTKIERPNNKELLCQHHNIKVNIFCENCQVLGCLLCVDDSTAHSGHKIYGIDEATHLYKIKLQQNFIKLEESQELLSSNIQDCENKLYAFQSSCESQRSTINEQCDGLINEVNSKRDFFLSDLEYEENSKTDNMEQQRYEISNKHSNVQSLILYTRDALVETVPEVFLQLAKSINERTQMAISAAKTSSPTAPTNLHHKVVDLRKEKVMLKDISYLTDPKTPVIDVNKCTRSVHSVVLVLCSPENEYDVIDEYRVYYNTENEEIQGVRHTMVFKTPGEQRKYGRGPPSLNAVCLIHNDLESNTTYSFSVRAYNEAGESDMSTLIQCQTLEESLTKLKVPEIVESMSRSYSYAIQIHSPSPCENNVEDDEVTFYLLYREAAADKIWKSISLCNRVDHRVFGLESDTMYDFVIMACGSSGECQVSNMVTLRTERSAY